MKNNNLDQKVQCDSCPWDGVESELEKVELNNGDKTVRCPNCADISISYMGHDE